MKLYIFKKHSHSHFERTPIELTSFHDHFIIIQQDKESIKLNWDDEYTFRDLHYGDVLLIYIIGDDFNAIKEILKSTLKLKPPAS